MNIEDEEIEDEEIEDEEIEEIFIYVTEEQIDAVFDEIESKNE